MARKFLTAIDLAKNELQNAKVQNLSAAPSSPVSGQEYYDTTLNQFGVYNGSGWVYMGSGTGDVSSNTSTSVDSEVALFNGTTGKSIKRASGTGIPKLASGVLSIATSGTDYSAGTSALATGILKSTTTTGALSIAASGTDYAPATSGSSALKGNGSGGFSNATLNDVGAATADYSINSHKLTSVLDPTAAQDAATKNYVDAVAANVHDYKDSVRAATTGALPNSPTYSNGTAGVGATLTAGANAAFPSIDGVSLSANDRILVANQATAAQNGIYTLTTVGSGAAAWVLTRATDADQSTEVSAGTQVPVESGTANGGQVWVLSTTGTITIGTTAQSWGFYFAATATQAGAGLTATGNVFAVGAGTGIVSNADSVTVDRSTNGSTVPFKYTATIGDGSTTAIAVTHSLGTQDVIAQVRDASTNAVVECDVVQTSTTVTTFTFATAPATNAIKVVIMG